MKKIYLFMAALLCGVTMNAKTIYLNTGGSSLWEVDGANHFAVWHWQGSGNGSWSSWMTSIGNNIWSVEISDSSDKVIFCRFNNAASNPDWNADMWNQTEDLEPGSNNLFTITGWGEGQGAKSVGIWSVYDGSDPGPGPTPQPGGDKDFFLKGYLGPNQGDITTPTAEELFECGVLANYAFEGDANGLGYFFILVCDAGQVVGKCYMAKDWDATATHCTLYDQESTGYHQVLPAPAPSATFYLYDNGDGTYELSISPLAGKTLVGGCGSEGVEQISAPKKAYKRVVNGQLLIYRGDKVFDATGRQL